MKWTEQLSSVNDGYLIIDFKTNELIGIIEADEGRYDMQIAMKMNQLGYVIMRLNFDELVDGGIKFKNKLNVQKATQQLMEGLQ